MSGQPSWQSVSFPNVPRSSRWFCCWPLFCLNIPSVPESVLNNGSVFVALKLNSVSFPGRNSGLPRRSNVAPTSPFWTFQNCIYLANVSLSASLLVLLAGDVSSNPGPVKDPCAICSKGCHSNQKAVQCDECNKWNHAKCINIGIVSTTRYLHETEM